MNAVKVNLGTFPTSITREQGLANADLEKRVSLFLKHEENTDELGMGIKIRQLEYLFATAKVQGATHLIADGVLDSHCCTAIAYYSKRFGLNSILVLKDEKPDAITGNHKLMVDACADVYYIGKNPEPQKLEQIKREIAGKYAAKGAKPMLVPTGATSEFTLFAGIDIAKEIESYEVKTGIKFDHIILPVGTGGIHFGLEIGKRLIDAQYGVIGIVIDNNPEEHYQQRFAELGQKFARMTGLSPALLKEPLQLCSAKGEGYGLFEHEDLLDIERIKRQNGIYLDPVYMHKSFKGLKQLIWQGKLKENSNVLMVYTGTS